MTFQLELFISECHVVCLVSQGWCTSRWIQWDVWVHSEVDRQSQEPGQGQHHLELLLTPARADQDVSGEPQYTEYTYSIESNFSYFCEITYLGFWPCSLFYVSHVSSMVTWGPCRRRWRYCLRRCRWRPWDSRCQNWAGTLRSWSRASDHDCRVYKTQQRCDLFLMFYSLNYTGDFFSS